MTSPSPEPVEREFVPDKRFQLDHDDPAPCCDHWLVDQHGRVRPGPRAVSEPCEAHPGGYTAPTPEPPTDPVFTGKPVCAIHGRAMEHDPDGRLFCPPCHQAWVSGLATSDRP